MPLILDKVACSAGSACHSDSHHMSPVRTECIYHTYFIVLYRSKVYYSKVCYYTVHFSSLYSIIHCIALHFTYYWPHWLSLNYTVLYHTALYRTCRCWQRWECLQNMGSELYVSPGADTPPRYIVTRWHIVSHYIALFDTMLQHIALRHVALNHAKTWRDMTWFKTILIII